MSDTSAICDEPSSDDSMVDSYSTFGTSVLELSDGNNTAAKEWTGPCCEKCDAPLTSGAVSICRHCGWYGSLNAFVEVDPSWEPDAEVAAAADKAPAKSHVQVWLQLVPRWGWIIIASLLVVIVESVVARFVTPPGSWGRTAWSLSQLAIGLVAVVGMHIFNFLVLAADDADIGLLDLLLKPIKLWARAAQNLPTRLWVADSAASGLAAVIMSLAVIGGIPYDRLWDWGLKEPPKQDLMGAVMNRVNQLDSGKSSDDLQQAIGDFAGGAGDEQKDKPKPEPVKPKNNADCVILGYFLDRDGRLATLVLGTASRGDLIYAGNVAPKLPANELQELTDRLKAIQIKKPFIKIESDANWVQAKYTCRVTFGQRTKAGRLQDLEWDKMLGRIGK